MPCKKSNESQKDILIFSFCYINKVKMSGKSGGQSLETGRSPIHLIDSNFRMVFQQSLAVIFLDNMFLFGFLLNA